MSKRHRNAPHPGYFKVAGGAVEEPDVARQAKQAVAREKSRLGQRAGHKSRMGEAPAEQHAQEHAFEEPLVATLKAELEAKGTPMDRVEAALMREGAPAGEPGLVRAVAGRAFGAARFMFGLAGRVVRLPVRMVRLPFQVIDWLRHHDQMHAA